jgi:hypothetical protein
MRDWVKVIFGLAKSNLFGINNIQPLLAVTRLFIHQYQNKSQHIFMILVSSGKIPVGLF